MIELPHHAYFPHKWFFAFFLCVYDFFGECLHCIAAFILNSTDQIDVCKIALPNLLDRSVSVVKASLNKGFCEKISPYLKFLWLQCRGNGYLFLIPLKYYRMKLWEVFLIFSFVDWKIEPATKRNTNHGVLFLDLYFCIFYLKSKHKGRVWQQAASIEVALTVDSHVEWGFSD